MTILVFLEKQCLKNNESLKWCLTKSGVSVPEQKYTAFNKEKKNNCEIKSKSISNKGTTWDMHRVDRMRSNLLKNGFWQNRRDVLKVKPFRFREFAMVQRVTWLASAPSNDRASESDDAALIVTPCNPAAFGFDLIRLTERNMIRKRNEKWYTWVSASNAPSRGCGCRRNSAHCGYARTWTYIVNRIETKWNEIEWIETKWQEIEWIESIEIVFSRTSCSATLMLAINIHSSTIALVSRVSYIATSAMPLYSRISQLSLQIARSVSLNNYLPFACDFGVWRSNESNL